MRVAYSPVRPHVEPLESRRLLSTSLVPVPDHRAVVYDARRSLLYIATEHGTLERYDVNAGRLLAPWTLGFTPAAADITPDGSTLYVLDSAIVDAQSSEGYPRRVGRVHHLDLATGAVTGETAYAAARDEHTPQDLVVAANGDVLFLTGTHVHEIGPASPFPFNPWLWELPGGPTAVPSIARPATLTRSQRGEWLMVVDEGGHTPRAFPVDGRTGNLGQSLGSMSYGPWSAISPDGLLVAGDGHLLNLTADRPRALPYTRGAASGGEPVVVASAFDPVRPLLYQVNAATDTIYAYDTATLVERSATPIGEPLERPDDFGKAPHSEVITVADDGSRLFLATGSGVRVYALTGKPTVLGLPPSVRPGVPYTFAVAFQDVAGNRDTNYAGTVRFGSADRRAALPADYTFTPADAGTATFTVTFKTARRGTPGTTTLSVAEIAAGGESDERSGIVVDPTPPTAELSWFGTYGRPPSGFGVALRDDVAIDPSSFGDGDLIVLAPGGGEIRPRYDNPQFPHHESKWSSQRFYIDPPGGTWDAADNGVYTVRLAPGALADAVGNVTDPARNAITFEVALGPAGERTDLPDLEATFADAGAVPAGAVAGTDLSTRPTLVLTNRGNRPVTGTTTISFSLVPAEGSTPSGGRSFPVVDLIQRLNLRPGQSKRLTLKLKLPGNAPAGAYHLSAWAKAEAADDSDLDNNGDRTAAFDVARRRVEMLSFGPGGLTAVRSFKPWTGVSFRVRNDGNAPAAGSFELQVYGLLDTEDADDGKSSGGREAGPLAWREMKLNLRPGQQKTLTFKVGLLGRPAGRYYLWLEGRSLDDDDDAYITPGE